MFRSSLQIGSRARRRWVLTAAELARTTQPVVFVWGDREPFGGPEVARRAAERLPSARVEIIPDAWPYPWLLPAEKLAVLNASDRC